LGFFTLVVLVVEGILGSVAAFSGTERSTALYGMLAIIGALIIVVAGFAVFRPEALSGIRQEQKLEEELQQARREAERSQAEKDRLDADFHRLEVQNQTLHKENDLLSIEVSSIKSVRSRIVAILLVRGSAQLPDILADLGIQFRSREHDQVLGILGALTEEGKVKRDTSMGGNYYMLTNT
jgi:hypothetical protein